MTQKSAEELQLAGAIVSLQEERDALRSENEGLRAEVKHWEDHLAAPCPGCDWCRPSWEPKIGAAVRIKDDARGQFVRCPQWTGRVEDECDGEYLIKLDDLREVWMEAHQLEPSTVALTGEERDLIRTQS